MTINFKDLRVPATFPTYPPYHTGQYLEEYFYDFYLKNKKDFDETGATLIPIFWTNVYNTRQNTHLVQTYLNALPEDGKYFTVAQHDDAIVEQVPNNTIQFSAGGLNGSVPIPLICSLIPENLKNTKVNKDLLCSFVGSLPPNADLRTALYDKLQGIDGFYFSNKRWWTPTIPEDKFKEFIDITQRSWFTLCPRGYGLQSFRFYEALQLGSIPVFVYDVEWFPFADVLDWTTFSICVHKDNISQIPEIINNISIEERNKMIEQGQRVYKEYFTLEGTCKQILLYLQRHKDVKTLSELMSYYQSDKSSKHHNYIHTYSRIFHSLKDKKLNVFELGLGTNNENIPSSMGKDGSPGASLRGWRDYFKNSKIYGADVDKDILFTENNIETFYVDQTQPESIKELWNNPLLKDITFDIIIDDGLHEFSANICFLKNSFHKLKENGIYVIEDITSHSLSLYNNELNELKTEFNFDFEIKNIINRHNNWDNILAVIYKK